MVQFEDGRCLFPEIYKDSSGKPDVSPFDIILILICTMNSS